MKKKSKRLDDILINYDHMDNHSEKKLYEITDDNLLCIKMGRPTNYRFNKDNKDYPFCVCKLTCLYKDYIEEKYHCRYFLEHKK
jgi:hypothetical protein